MGVVHEVERTADGRHLAAKFVPQLSDKKSLLRFMPSAARFCGSFCSKAL